MTKGDNNDNEIRPDHLRLMMVQRLLVSLLLLCLTITSDVLSDVVDNDVGAARTETAVDADDVKISNQTNANTTSIKINKDSATSVDAKSIYERYTTFLQGQPQTYFNPKQEYRYNDDPDTDKQNDGQRVTTTTLIGQVHATERIEKGEVLADIPWDVMFNRPSDSHRGGVHNFCDVAWNLARELRLRQEQRRRTNSQQETDQATSTSSSLTSHSTKESLLLDMVMVRMKLHPIPSMWSKQARKLLADIVGDYDAFTTNNGGDDDHHEETLYSRPQLPPQHLVNNLKTLLETEMAFCFSNDDDDVEGEEEESEDDGKHADMLLTEKDIPYLGHAMAILIGRGVETYGALLPAMEIYPHQRGLIQQTMTQQQDAVSKVNAQMSTVMFRNQVVHATRTIEADEAIYLSYDRCTECHSPSLNNNPARQQQQQRKKNLLYGTAHLFRDYGIVENYPQRWIFYDTSLVFDLDQVTLRSKGNEYDDDNDIRSDTGSSSQEFSAKTTTTVVEVVKWHKVPKLYSNDFQFAKVWLRREIRRLYRLKTIGSLSEWTSIKSPRDVRGRDDTSTEPKQPTQQELDNTWKFYNANLLALTKALEGLEALEESNKMANKTHDKAQSSWHRTKESVCADSKEDDYSRNEANGGDGTERRIVPQQVNNHVSGQTKTRREGASDHLTGSHYDPLDEPEILDTDGLNSFCDSDEYDHDYNEEDFDGDDDDGLNQQDSGMAGYSSLSNFRIMEVARPHTMRGHNEIRNERPNNFLWRFSHNKEYDDVMLEVRRQKLDKSQNMVGDDNPYRQDSNNGDDEDDTTGKDGSKKTRRYNTMAKLKKQPKTITTRKIATSQRACFYEYPVHTAVSSFFLPSSLSPSPSSSSSIKSTTSRTSATVSTSNDAANGTSSTSTNNSTSSRREGGGGGGGIIRRVMIIGGDTSFILHEVWKYQSTLELVVILEPHDPILVRKVWQYFNAAPYFDDDRVQWWFIGNSQREGYDELVDIESVLRALPDDYWGSFDMVFISDDDKLLWPSSSPLSSSSCPFSAVSQSDGTTSLSDPGTCNVDFGNGSGSTKESSWMDVHILRHLIQPRGVMLFHGYYLGALHGYFRHTFQLAFGCTGGCSRLYTMCSQDDSIIDLLLSKRNGEHVSMTKPPINMKRTFVYKFPTNPTDRFLSLRDYRYNDQANRHNDRKDDKDDRSFLKLLSTSNITSTIIVSEILDVTLPYSLSSSSSTLDDKDEISQEYDLLEQKNTLYNLLQSHDYQVLSSTFGYSFSSVDDDEDASEKDDDVIETESAVIVAHSTFVLANDVILFVQMIPSRNYVGIEIQSTLRYYPGDDDKQQFHQLRQLQSEELRRIILEGLVGVGPEPMDDDYMVSSYYQVTKTITPRHQSQYDNVEGSSLRKEESDDDVGEVGCRRAEGDDGDGSERETSTDSSTIEMERKMSTATAPVSRTSRAVVQAMIPALTDLLLDEVDYDDTMNRYYDSGSSENLFVLVVCGGPGSQCAGADFFQQNSQGPKEDEYVVLRLSSCDNHEGKKNVTVDERIYLQDTYTEEEEDYQRHHFPSMVECERVTEAHIRNFLMGPKHDDHSVHDDEDDDEDEDEDGRVVGMERKFDVLVVDEMATYGMVRIINSILSDQKRRIDILEEAYVILTFSPLTTPVSSVTGRYERITGNMKLTGEDPSLFDYRMNFLDRFRGYDESSPIAVGKFSTLFSYHQQGRDEKQDIVVKVGVVLSGETTSMFNNLSELRDQWSMELEDRGHLWSDNAGDNHDMNSGYFEFVDVRLDEIGGDRYFVGEESQSKSIKQRKYQYATRSFRTKKGDSTSSFTAQSSTSHPQQLANEVILHLQASADNEIGGPLMTKSVAEMFSHLAIEMNFSDCSQNNPQGTCNDDGSTVDNVPSVVQMSCDEAIFVASIWNDHQQQEQEEQGRWSSGMRFSIVSFEYEEDPSILIEAISKSFAVAEYRLDIVSVFVQPRGTGRLIEFYHGDVEEERTHYPFVIEAWENGNVHDVDDVLDCDRLLSVNSLQEERLYNTSSWKLFHEVYEGVVGKELASTSGYRLTDFPGSNIRIDFSPEAGRGIFASKFIARGSLICDSTNTAEFRHGIHFRQFLRRLPPLMACDILQWAFMSHSHLLGQPVACVDLGRGSFMNAGSGATDTNCGPLFQVTSTPSFKQNTTTEEGTGNKNGIVKEEKKMDGCSYQLYALRDIRPGEEIRAEYDSFGDARLWREILF